MEYRHLEKLNIKTSLLGFGTMRLPLTSDGKIDELLAEKMIDYADKLLNGIEIMSDTNELPKSENSFNLDELVKKWKRSFDLEFGGYSRAPKFMMPTNLDFLQTYDIQY